MLALETFDCNCNSEVFNTWLENSLIPELPSNTVIVMDNAAFHKSAKTRQIIEKSGHTLKFLPPYSPDLNPIENCWHQIKSRLRPIIQGVIGNLSGALEEVMKFFEVCYDWGGS